MIGAANGELGAKRRVLSGFLAQISAKQAQAASDGRRGSRPARVRKPRR